MAPPSGTRRTAALAVCTLVGAAAAGYDGGSAAERSGGSNGGGGRALQVVGCAGVTPVASFVGVTSGSVQNDTSQFSSVAALSGSCATGAPRRC
jgi:hypothetical protein